jgi:hypothetical protein
MEKFLGSFPRIGRNFSECMSESFHEYIGKIPRNFAQVDSSEYLLTYLCGTTTNIWLRPVQEDLSMTACLEHSAFNL